MSADLYDAIERREFASYIQFQGKEYKEFPPYCELKPISQEETICSSKQEFDAFVSKFMEQ
jgi:hypothetical protein